MASSISTLSSLLLNPYAQTALSSIQNKQASDPFKPGSTVTARYTVGDDGELQLRQVDVGQVDAINQGEDQAARQQQKKASEESDRRSYSLADVAKPKAQLSPSDEVSLFAAIANQPLRLAPPKAVEKTNPNITDIEFEEAPAETAPATTSLAAQKQQQVAGLYARNLDITYNITPVYSEAA